MFTASNGISIHEDDYGFLKWSSREYPNNPHRIFNFSTGSPLSNALAEFYEHQKDVELDRWRDPVEPHMVVYRDPSGDDGDGRCVQVVDETTGNSMYKRKNLTADPTAERYFAAHPEPKPWLEAKEGEVWEITYRGETHTVFVRSWGERSIFMMTEIGSPSLGRTDPDITAGKRVWPNEDV